MRYLLILLLLATACAPDSGPLDDDDAAEDDDDAADDDDAVDDDDAADDDDAVDDDDAADDDDAVDDDDAADDDDATPIGPRIELDPQSFDFGNLELGCEASVQVAISNTGGAPLTVSSLEFEDLVGTGELELLELPVLPQVLDPATAFEVTVVYTPLDVQADSSVLHAFSDDLTQSDATAQQFGIASLGEDRLDQHLQEGNNSTDILFVVDSTGSMAEEQGLLGSDFSAFISVATALDLDYQLGVVNMEVADGGALQGSPAIVTPNTAAPGAAFAANLSVGLGGLNAEAGFHSALLALSPPMTDPSMPNEGFLREDAGLRLVFVSDETEQSGYLGWAPADFLVWFQGLKPNPLQVILSDITGGASGCTGSGGPADAAPSYAFTTSNSGGLSASICDASWVATLESLAWLSQSFADTFVLSAQPVADTIAVALNTVPVFVGWTYDPVLNAVVFDEDHVPENGDAVDIEYTGLGVDCPE